MQRNSAYIHSRIHDRVFRAASIILGLLALLFISASCKETTLAQNGLYLAYLKDNTLIFLNSDGRGRRVLGLPENGYVPDLGKAMSPDGHWMVIHLGKVSSSASLDITPETSINLIHIPDGSIRPITRLFPEGIDNLSNWGDYGNIMAYDWSPDGRYLAFAGAMDGPLSELYVVDIETNTIRRLTNDSVNIWLIDWSPDGQWIWFESIEKVPTGDRYSFYATKFNENTIHTPTLFFTSLRTQGEWISANLYFLYARSDDAECPLHHFRYINVETGQTTALWARIASSFALDKNNKLLAVSTWCGEGGTFFADWNGITYTKIYDDPLYLQSWGSGNFSFLCNNYYGQVWGIDQYDTMTHLSDTNFTEVSVSPDIHWFVLYKYPYYSDSTGAGMTLFSEDNHYHRTIPDQSAHPVAWSRDSTGLFFISSGLYYVAIPDGQPVLIDDCEPNGCDEPFVWLP